MTFAKHWNHLCMGPSLLLRAFFSWWVTQPLPARQSHFSLFRPGPHELKFTGEALQMSGREYVYWHVGKCTEKRDHVPESLSVCVSRSTCVSSLQAEIINYRFKKNNNKKVWFYPGVKEQKANLRGWMLNARYKENQPSGWIISMTTALNPVFAGGCSIPSVTATITDWHFLVQMTSLQHQQLFAVVLWLRFTILFSLF